MAEEEQQAPERLEEPAPPPASPSGLPGVPGAPPQGFPQWAEVKDLLAQEFPDLDPGEMQKRWEQQATMARVRRQYAGMEEPTEAYLARKSIPFASAIGNAVFNQRYKAAMDRLNNGRPNPDDYGLIAQYEQQHRLDAERAGSLTGMVQEAAATAPAIIGEMAVGGKALTTGLKGLGVAGRIGELATGMLGQTLSTPLAPSLYIPQALERAERQGGQFYEGRNLAPPLAMAGLTNMIFGATGEMGKNIANPATRLLAKVGAGMGAIEGAEDIASVVDFMLPKEWETESRFGTIGALVDGRQGDAMKKATVNALTLMGFALMHGNPGKAEDIKRQLLLTYEREAGKGSTPDRAASEMGKVLDMIWDKKNSVWRAPFDQPDPGSGDIPGEFDQVHGYALNRKAIFTKPPQPSKGKPDRWVFQDALPRYGGLLGYEPEQPPFDPDRGPLPPQPPPPGPESFQQAQELHRRGILPRTLSEEDQRKLLAHLTGSEPPTQGSGPGEPPGELPPRPPGGPPRPDLLPGGREPTGPQEPAPPPAPEPEGGPITPKEAKPTKDMDPGDAQAYWLNRVKKLRRQGLAKDQPEVSRAQALADYYGAKGEGPDLFGERREHLSPRQWADQLEAEGLRADGRVRDAQLAEQRANTDHRLGIISDTELDRAATNRIRAVRHRTTLQEPLDRARAEALATQTPYGPEEAAGPPRPPTSTLYGDIQRQRAAEAARMRGMAQPFMQPEGPYGPLEAYGPPAPGAQLRTQNMLQRMREKQGPKPPREGRQYAGREGMPTLDDLEKGAAREADIIPGEATVGDYDILKQIREAKKAKGGRVLRQRAVAAEPAGEPEWKKTAAELTPFDYSTIKTPENWGDWTPEQRAEWLRTGKEYSDHVRDVQADHDATAASVRAAGGDEASVRDALRAGLRAGVEDGEAENAAKAAGRRPGAEAQPAPGATPEASRVRAAAVLDRLRAQREVAQEELDRAFPHGRPEGDAGKGYDDRARQVAENDRLIKTLEDRLREPGAAPKPPKPAPKYPPGFGSTMKKIEAGTHPFEWGADLMQQARAAGFTPDQLHAAAQEMQAKNESTYREHNELHDSLKAAIRRQYPELSNQQFGKMYKKVLAEGDSTQIRNFDVIQQNHNDRIDMGFADPADTSKTLDQEERFWKVLQAGHHEKLPQEVAYSNGLKHLLADRATGAAQNAALRSGQPAAAVEASLRSGEAAGLRKAAEQARQESESAGGARPPGPGAEAPEGTQRPGGPEVPAAGTTGPGTTPDYGAQSPGINRALHNLADHIAADHAPGGGANEQQSGGGLKEPGIRNFFTDESGAVDVDRVRKAVKGAFLDAKDGLMEMAGASFPALHRLSERVGVEVSRMANAQNYLKVRTPLMIDQVLGPNAKEDFQNLMGATVNERRLRWMKNASLAEANIAGTKAADLRDRAVQETDPERRADMLKAATEYARQSTEWLSKKNKIISLIGTDNFPLKTFEDYKRAVKSPEFEAMLDRSTRHMTPEMERNFRDAFGMEDDDPINSWSQVRRGGIVEPFNFKAIEPGDDSPTAAFVMGRNNFKNLKAGKYVFGEEASGSAPAYEYNMAKLIENSMAKGYPTAAKARALRAMVEEGVGRFDKPGQGKKGEVEFPFTNPPKDMGLTEGGPASLYLPEGDPAREWSRALGLNTRYDQKLFPRFLHAITGGALKSTVEATWHVANNLTALLKSGVHPWDLVVEGINILRKDESTRERLADLAMIGAKTAQERGSNWNPFNYLTRFVHIVQDAQRLTLDNAFNRLVARPDFLGGAVNSASNRRDFINTLGQYNKRTQNEWVALARDTGVGDFATAGTNFAVNSARSMVGGQGVKTRTVAGDIALRTEYLTKVAALLGGIGLANYLRWGNPLGDDQTPLGAYKVGEDNGRTSYIELAKIFAAPVRGLRETGILAYLDGWRHKQDPGTATDRARDAAVQAVLHPFFGPGAQFLHTVATGKDVLGRQVAEPAKYGHSQTWEDLKAAMWHINPSVATIAGKDQPGHEPTVGEKIGAAFGPFGVKTKGPSKPDEVLDFYRAMHADETQQQLQRRANTAKGLATKRPAIQEFFRRTAAAINKLELAHNNPATAEEAKPAIREQQRRLAIQAMEIRKRELGE